MTNAVRNGMISDNYIFRACPERTKAMTGTVRAVHKRREGAAGVSSHEAAPNARPGAALLNRRLGRDGFPSVSGAASAREHGFRELRWYHGVFVLFGGELLYFFAEQTKIICLFYHFGG